MSTHLNGKSTLVTGGASGIGAAAARRFAQAGASVVVADVDAEAAEAVAAEIGGRAWVVDLADSTELTEHLAGEFPGEVDVLVNNAGIQIVAPIEEFAYRDFARIHAIMLHAPFLLMQAALPGMYKRGWGRIINISSVHGLRASEYKSAYVSAKHGLEGLSKVAAQEAAGRGVTSNCVNPGYVRTPLVEGQITEQAHRHQITEAEVIEQIMLTRSPVKRLVEPEEVAELVEFFTTDAARMVTGASYTIDGGWTSR